MPHHGKKFILLGAGGHARVLRSLFMELDLEIAGVCDPGLSENGIQSWEGLAVLGGDEALDSFDSSKYSLANGIGPVIGQNVRQTLFENYRTRFEFPPLIHHTAWVAKDVILADGVQVMAGAIIQPGCYIGTNTVINTRASIDHDCKIGPNSHIAPGAVLCGGVTIEDNTFIGAGSTVIQSITIKRGSIVGAGTTCVRDLNAKETIIGPGIRRLTQSPKQ